MFGPSEKFVGNFPGSLALYSSVHTGITKVVLSVIFDGSRIFRDCVSRLELGYGAKAILRHALSSSKLLLP
uniref:Uncharacterized protein n=1 Tax=Candidatus Kentrum sp. LPFa TaxID=2126335 RepID=A0A450VXR3_9GAMM|nr:MAG: hypothetical protein BECKLPF1236B_GA0070989_100912 [Candidatus Kentron sp. LPFa]